MKPKLSVLKDLAKFHQTQSECLLNAEDIMTSETDMVSALLDLQPGRWKTLLIKWTHKRTYNTNCTCFHEIKVPGTLGANLRGGI